MSTAASTSEVPVPLHKLHRILSAPQLPSPSHSLKHQTIKAGKQREQLSEPLEQDSPVHSSSRHRKSSSADLFPSSFASRDSSWVHLWNPLNSSLSVTASPKGPRSKYQGGLSRQRTTVRKTRSLPLRTEDRTDSGPSSLRVETSNGASSSSSPHTPAPGPSKIKEQGPPEPIKMLTTESTAPSVPDKDPEHSAVSNDTDDVNHKPANEIPWGPAHPCYPHINPHVPLSSPLHTTTRIIRIRRDWMIVGDLAPTFSNIYPEILEPWVSEADFRELIQNVNDRLIAAFRPGGWRAWLDTILGLATGWIWEDLGFNAVKSRLRDTEQYIEKWNGREGKMGAEGDIDSAKVVPLRRTAYLSLDIQIPDPQVGVVETPTSKPSSPPLTPEK